MKRRVPCACSAQVGFSRTPFSVQDLIEKEIGPDLQLSPAHPHLRTRTPALPSKPARVYGLGFRV